MKCAIKIRLPKELAAWLNETALRTRVAEEQIIVGLLEKARATERSSLRRAGKIRGPADLSSRSGFSTRAPV